MILRQIQVVSVAPFFDPSNMFPTLKFCHLKFINMENKHGGAHFFFPDFEYCLDSWGVIQFSYEQINRKLEVLVVVCEKL